MNANTTWIVWFAAALFCGGLALLALRLAWWWWALRKVEREIAMYERKRKQQEQEIRHKNWRKRLPLSHTPSGLRDPAH